MFGDYLWNWRNGRGVTQPVLARRLGISTEMLASIECGRRHGSLSTRARIERMIALGRQRHDDEHYVYMLGVARRGALFRPLADECGRRGFVCRRQLADSACQWLAALGVADVVAAPIWPEAAGRAAARAGAVSFSSGSYLLDATDNAAVMAQRVLSWMDAAVVTHLSHSTVTPHKVKPR